MKESLNDNISSLPSESMPLKHNSLSIPKNPAILNKKPIRQIIRFSNYSLCITLPKEFVDILNWCQGDRIKFQIDPQSQQLILSKHIPETSLITKQVQKQSPKLILDNLEPILPIKDN